MNITTVYFRMKMPILGVTLYEYVNRWICKLITLTKKHQVLQLCYTSGHVNHKIVQENANNANRLLSQSRQTFSSGRPADKRHKKISPFIAYRWKIRDVCIPPLSQFPDWHLAGFILFTISKRKSQINRQTEIIASQLRPGIIVNSFWLKLFSGKFWEKNVSNPLIRCFPNTRDNVLLLIW